MHRKKRFLGALIVELLSLILTIYSALPGVYHVLVSGSHSHLDPQPMSMVLFTVLTILSTIVVLINRPHAIQWS
jgi:hypothetical protein